MQYFIVGLNFLFDFKDFLSNFVTVIIVGEADARELIRNKIPLSLSDVK